MKNINYLIKTSNWEKIIKTYNINDILSHVSFKDCILLVYRMLYNNAWDEEIQNYAVNMLYAIKKKWPEEWNSSWTYDAFLGNACNITLRYDERYEAYKNALEKAEPVSPSLLVMLAKCYISPGTPPINLETAEVLLKNALKQEISVEGAALMKRICERKNEEKAVDYWNSILEEATKKNLHVHGLLPPILKDVSLNKNE